MTSETNTATPGLREASRGEAKKRIPLGQLDAVVLGVLRQRGWLQTYVIANWIGSSPGWRRPSTASVLRSCRRLQKRGLIEETRSSYAVMKTWRPAPPTQQETGHDQ